MQKENPLAMQIYSDPCYVAVVRELRYEGCVYRDLHTRLAAIVAAMPVARVPFQHVSLRVPWHDLAWRGTVCKDPRRDAACLVLAPHPGDAGG